MLERTKSVSFRDIPDGAFFQVSSPSAYGCSFLLSVADDQLPEQLRDRTGDPEPPSVLFKVAYIECLERVPTRVFIKEIDFDLSDDTLVTCVTPVPHMPHGAQVYLGTFRAGPTWRINSKGFIQSLRSSRREGSSRGGRGRRSDRKQAHNGRKRFA